MAYVAIADRDAPIHDPHTFIEKYIWSQDHKVIAIQYAIVAIFVGLVALVLSGLMRLQLGFPETFHFVDPNHYYQFITMHGMIMVIYLLTALFLGGFGNYLIPLMVGARDMVFPYMNMVSFWVYLLAVLVLLSSFFVPGGPTGAAGEGGPRRDEEGRHAMVDIPSTAGDVIPPAEVADVELYHPKSWWTRYVFSQDAKVIAIQYSLTAFAIGFVALVLSWLMRLQLGFPGYFSFIDADHYYQFITMHGMIMVIYLLTALFLGGFGNYLIPLMLGARDMVFPYANMLSYWLYLVAVLVLAAGFFAPGGPTGAGWTLYPPQAILGGTPGGQQTGILLMLASLMLFIIGFTMGGLNYVVTVLQGRTRGMTLMRMPLTVWGIFTATVMALLAFPALFVAAVMMLFDRLLGTSFFMPSIVEMGEQLKSQGGSPILFQHLFWFFGHPEVYIVALPAFGIVSDLISTHARKNIFGYRMMVWAIVIIGALSFVVWAHHMYVSGMDPRFGFFFATTTLIIAVPTAIKVYNWVLTLWRGDIHLTLPMLFALGFIVTFVNGGLTGLFLGNVVVDVPLSDTMFVVAHFHMVMGVAPIMVVFGPIYHR